MHETIEWVFWSSLGYCTWTLYVRRWCTIIIKCVPDAVIVRPAARPPALPITQLPPNGQGSSRCVKAANHIFLVSPLTPSQSRLKAQMSVIGWYRCDGQGLECMPSLLTSERNQFCFLAVACSGLELASPYSSAKSFLLHFSEADHFLTQPILLFFLFLLRCSNSPMIHLFIY